MNISWFRMKILVQQTLLGTRIPVDQWYLTKYVTAILGCFPPLKCSPIWLDPCCYFCKLSLGLVYFLMPEIKCFMKEWSTRGKDVWGQFNPCFIPLGKNECIWKPALFKANQQLINWFLIWTSFYWVLCMFVMLAGDLSGEQTSCSILCYMFDNLTWYQNDSGFFTSFKKEYWLASGLVVLTCKPFPCKPLLWYTKILGSCNFAINDCRFPERQMGSISFGKGILVFIYFFVWASLIWYVSCTECLQNNMMFLM